MTPLAVLALVVFGLVFLPATIIAVTACVLAGWISRVEEEGEE